MEIAHCFHGGNHHLSCYLHVCHSAVECSRENDSVKGRSSHTDVFCKKDVLKILQYPKENSCTGVSF